MKHERNLEWWRQAILYHIYPLSFADSNGDGYGDLPGIIEHLDYLSGHPDSLGINAIWLSPVYCSPMKDWGYDVANYADIDPRFGSLAEFDSLVVEAHRRGMRVLMDYVANHTSDQHPWFVESRSGRTSHRRDWYIWAEPKPDGAPPNNWLSRFGGPAWTLDETTGQYYMHTFLASQPDLNWHNPEVRAAMLDVLRYWLRRGVDGFRTDAIYDIMKDPKLRDDPPNPNFRPGMEDPFDALIHRRSSGQAELAGVVADMSNTIAEFPGAIMLSEAYLNVADMRWLYRASRHHNHSPFNFNLMSLPWEAETIGRFIADYEASLRPDDLPNYVLSNHDRVRLASRVGAERARLLAFLQLTLRGLPVIYYGDEIGMENAVITTAQERDPWGIQVPGFGLGRDGERTPMQWSAGHASGFTAGQPWLPTPAKSRTNNVAAQRADKSSLWHLYHRLIKLRHDYPALASGSYRPVAASKQVLIYDRAGDGQTFRIVLNFGAESAKLGPVSGQLLASTHEGSSVALEAYEGRLYRLEELV